MVIGNYLPLQGLPAASTARCCSRSILASKETTTNLRVFPICNDRFPKGDMARLRDLLSSLYIQSAPINLINETYIPKLEGKKISWSETQISWGGKKGAKETASPLTLCSPPHCTPKMPGVLQGEHWWRCVGPPCFRPPCSARAVTDCTRRRAGKEGGGK